MSLFLLHTLIGIESNTKKMMMIMMMMNDKWRKTWNGPM
jgi:hypothetical protein